MRIVIFSDLHANAAALDALDGSYDELWFLGDIVGYGPDVAAAIDFVRHHAVLAIRGNHDNAAVTDDRIGCSPANEPLALATRDYTRSLLDDSHAAYLKGLPLALTVERAGARFCLTHGSPRDPLYEYMRPSYSDQELATLVEGLDSDVVLLGHTHLPMVRQIGRAVILNPGSLGQPRDGDTRVAYVVWEVGEFRQQRVPYDLSHHLHKVRQMPLPPPLLNQLYTLQAHARSGWDGVKMSSRFPSRSPC